MNVRFPFIQPLLSFFRRRSVRRDSDPFLKPPTVLRADVERLTGRTVGNLDLYQQALLHRSVIRGQSNYYVHSNERLEFLGDAILGFIVAEHIYQQFPDEDEGFLTRLRAQLVNGQALAGYARMNGLGELVLLSDNMEQVGGRDNPTILADAFEAIIGALYLDHGEDAARSFVQRTILDVADLEDLADRRDNYKSLLLEYAQANGWSQPQYRVTMEEGPSHDKQFTVEVLVKGGACGQGRARNKKAAEQLAAERALEILKGEE